jgi:SprT protein
MHTPRAPKPEARDPALERRAAERTRRLIAAAASHFHIEIAAPDIRFDLRGRAAGQVRIVDGRHCVVRYNPVLLVRHSEEFLAQTVPHETAHLIVFRLYGTHRRPHGAEWQRIMRLFGARPERCHSFEVGDLQTRSLQQFAYRCGCREHRLSSIRHRRALRGQVYLCRYCGTPLRPMSLRTGA